MVLVLRSNGRWLETHPSHEVTCGRHEDNFSSHPLRYLWVNDYSTASNLCLLLLKEQNVKGGEGPSGKQAVGINNGTR